MTLQECYKAFDGDYQGVLARLRSDALICKFVIKFLDDKSMEQLTAAIDKRDAETAFRASHTIKGVCQNLGFTGLGVSSSALTEALRGGWSDEAPALFRQVKSDYEVTIGAINNLKDNRGD